MPVIHAGDVFQKWVWNFNSAKTERQQIFKAKFVTRVLNGCKRTQNQLKLDKIF